MSTVELQNEDRYLLGRGRMESARLNFQHFALTRRLGWSFHPDVENAIEDKKKIRIVDLGTGTGIWACELARDYSDAEIVGLDVSDLQFPPKVTWPSNVRLEKHDLIDTPPGKYQGYFDIVHVRMLVAGIYHLDRDLLVKNIIDMMKPGGVIQWEELTEYTCLTVEDGQVIGRGSSPMSVNMKNVADFSAAVSWAAHLPSVLERLGLESVVGYDPPIVPSALPLETEVLYWGIQETIKNAIAVGRPGAEKELAEAIDSSEAIFAKGHLWAYAFGVTIAKRPL